MKKMTRVNARKIIAVLTALGLMGTSVAPVYSGTPTTLWSDRPSTNTSSLRNLPVTPALSQLRTQSLEAFGSIENEFTAEPNSSVGKVYLIQDIHLNTSAQKNIARLLTHLIENKNVNLVGVEGAFEKFDFSPYRTGSLSVREDVAGYFLKSNRIAAPSYVGVTMKKDPPAFVGVDDPVRHSANVAAYLATRKNAQVEEGKIDLRLAEIKAAKMNRFSGALKVFDERVSNYWRGKRSFHEMAMDYAREMKTPVLSSYVRAAELETALDWDALEKEKKELMAQLADRVSPEDVRRLMALRPEAQFSPAAMNEYLSTFKKTLLDGKVSLSKFPQLQNYFEYVRLSATLKGEDLVREMDAFIETKLVQLATDKRDRDLIQTTAWLYLAKKLVRFELTDHEWRAFLSADRPEPKSWALYKRFYFEADARSRIMVQKLIRASQDENLTANHALALVAGGFHSEHLAAKLKEANISFEVIRPHFELGGEYADYLSFFNRNESPLENLLEGQQLTVAPRTLALGTPLGPKSFKNIQLVAEAFRATGAASQIKTDRGDVIGAERLPEGTDDSGIQIPVRTPQGQVDLHIGTRQSFLSKLIRRVSQLFKSSKSRPISRPRDRRGIMRLPTFEVMETRFPMSAMSLIQVGSDFETGDVAAEEVAPLDVTINDVAQATFQERQEIYDPPTDVDPEVIDQIVDDLFAEGAPLFPAESSNAPAWALAGENPQIISIGDIPGDGDFAILVAPEAENLQVRIGSKNSLVGVSQVLPKYWDGNAIPITEVLDYIQVTGAEGAVHIFQTDDLSRPLGGRYDIFSFDVQPGYDNSGTPGQNPDNGGSDGNGTDGDGSNGGGTDGNGTGQPGNSGGVSDSDLGIALTMIDEIVGGFVSPIGSIQQTTSILVPFASPVLIGGKGAPSSGGQVFFGFLRSGDSLGAFPDSLVNPEETEVLKEMLPPEFLDLKWSFIEPDALAIQLDTVTGEGKFLLIKAEPNRTVRLQMGSEAQSYYLKFAETNENGDVVINIPADVEYVSIEGAGEKAFAVRIAEGDSRADEAVSFSRLRQLGEPVVAPDGDRSTTEGKPAKPAPETGSSIESTEPRPQSNESVGAAIPLLSAVAAAQRLKADTENKKKENAKTISARSKNAVRQIWGAVRGWLPFGRTASPVKNEAPSAIVNGPKSDPDEPVVNNPIEASSLDDLLPIESFQIRDFKETLKDAEKTDKAKKIIFVAKAKNVEELNTEVSLLLKQVDFSKKYEVSILTSVSQTEISENLGALSQRRPVQFHALSNYTSAEDIEDLFVMSDQEWIAQYIQIYIAKGAPVSADLMKAFQDLKTDEAYADHLSIYVILDSIMSVTAELLDAETLLNPELIRLIQSQA